MSFEKIKLQEMLTFSNGKTSPDRVIAGEYVVYGANGTIGLTDEKNAPQNTIVIGRVGSYCGAVHFSKDECWVTDNAIKANVKNHTNPYYAYHLLSYLDLNRYRVGSGQPLINQSILNSIEVPNIDLNQQNKISYILKKLDKKIDLLNEINQTLESIAQAIFKSWFVDFDPVHAKQQGIECAGIDKTSADLFPSSFVESELGLIPKGWEVKAIGECLQVVDFVANGSFAALKENVTLFREPNYALYVRTTDYNSNFNGDFRFVDERAYRFLSKSFLVGDETIISNVGDVGTVFRAPKWLGYLMTLGSNAVALKNKEMPTYVYYFFKSNKGQHLIQSIITGSAQLKFNKTSLRSKSILIPSKSTLDCFENITSAITEKMDTNQNGIKLLQNIRDTLLPRLISGKLDLSNIAEQIEGVA